MTTKPHMILLLAIAATTLAASANAATPKKPATPTAPAAPHEMRVVVTDDDADAPGDMEWTSEDGTKRVITRRIVRGGGMGGGECGMGGPGMGGRECGMGAHGRGMHMGMGPGGRGMGHGMGGPGMGRGMGAGMGQHFAMILRHLDLSDAQKQKLRDLHERQMRRDIQARADIEIAEMDLRNAMHAETPNASAINAQIDKVSKLRADQQKAHVAALMEARALLTPEQQKKAHEMMEKGPEACMGGGGMPGCGMGEGPGAGAMPGCDMGAGPGKGMGMGPGGMGGPQHRMRVQVMRDSVGHGAQ